MVGWGTMFNVAHLVRAVRTLHAAGQCYAALLLLRSVMEYALGTIWLADAGEDAVDVLNRKLQGLIDRALPSRDAKRCSCAAWVPEVQAGVGGLSDIGPDGASGLLPGTGACYWPAVLRLTASAKACS